MKWFWIIVLIVIGIVGVAVGAEYLSTGIGHLPTWFPGYHVHHRGHLRKRGYAALLVGIVAFAGAGWLIYKNQQAGKAAAGGPPAPAPDTSSAAAAD